PYYTKVHPELAVRSTLSSTTPWTDHKGLPFIDVSSRPFWDYIVAISKESYALGFDELNYDYIRYPSDGPMKEAVFINNNKAEALEGFFKYLHEQVHPTGAKMSADLFGYTAILTDDLGIGQQLERALPYFDFIAPMVYPSHYNKGFAGLSNPNTDPHKVVFTSMAAAVARTRAEETTVKAFNGEEIFINKVTPAYYNENNEFIATSTHQVSSGKYTKPIYDAQKLRPWLQDFDYGGDYDIAEVRAQIQATYDAGLTSWMLWSPSNRYTRGALESAQE
ncbi:MAG: putative glycoside hydrolase, partial [Candidatus Paceibacterota bacterium]